MPSSRMASLLRPLRDRRAALGAGGTQPVSGNRARAFRGTARCDVAGARHGRRLPVSCCRVAHTHGGRRLGVAQHRAFRAVVAAPGHVLIHDFHRIARSVPRLRHVRAPVGRPAFDRHRRWSHCKALRAHRARSCRHRCAWHGRIQAAGVELGVLLARHAHKLLDRSMPRPGVDASVTREGRRPNAHGRSWRHRTWPPLEP